MASDSEPRKFFWGPRGPSRSHILGSKCFSTAISAPKNTCKLQ